MDVAEETDAAMDEEKLLKPPCSFLKAKALFEIVWTT